MSEPIAQTDEAIKPRRWSPTNPGRTDLPPVAIYPEWIVDSLHADGDCYPELCALHGPSDHDMVGWPINVRVDRPFSLIERICEHGTGHPDPDSLAYVERRWVEYGRPKMAEVEGWHGCDGCCWPGPKQ
jgi:hypothetical protein